MLIGMICIQQIMGQFLIKVVVGSAPYRKLVIEWKVRNLSNDGGAGFTKTIQAWLFEGTNVIQYVYGNGQNSGNGSTIGLRGSTAANFNEVTTTTQTNSIITSNDVNVTWPGSGTSYIFTPSVACPSNITAQNAPGSCDTVITWVPPNAADNCGMASFVSSHLPGSSFPVGITTVVYTATDVNWQYGNMFIYGNGYR